MQTVDRIRSDKQQARNIYIEMLLGHDVRVQGDNHVRYGYEMLKVSCEQMGLTPEQFRDHMNNELARQFKVDRIVNHYLSTVIETTDFASDLTRRQLYAILQGKRPDMLPKESAIDMYARRISQSKSNKISRFDYRVSKGSAHLKKNREDFINHFLPNYILPFIKIDENVLYNLYEKSCEKAFFANQLKKAKLTPQFYVEKCDGLGLLHIMLPPRWESEERIVPTLEPGDIPLYRSETLYSYFRYKLTAESYKKMPPLELARQLKKDHQIYHLGMPTVDGLKALGVENNIEPYIPWLIVYLENDENGIPIFNPKNLDYPIANLERIKAYLMPIYKTYKEHSDE